MKLLYKVSCFFLLSLLLPYSVVSEISSNPYLYPIEVEDIKEVRDKTSCQCYKSLKTCLIDDINEIIGGASELHINSCFEEFSYCLSQAIDDFFELTCLPDPEKEDAPDEPELFEPPFGGVPEQNF